MRRARRNEFIEVLRVDNEQNDNTQSEESNTIKSHEELYKEFIESQEKRLFIYIRLFSRNTRKVN